MRDVVEVTRRRWLLGHRWRAYRALTPTAWTRVASGSALTRRLARRAGQRALR